MACRRSGIWHLAGGNIILTYENDGKTDFQCLIKWAPDGTGDLNAHRVAPCVRSARAATCPVRFD